MPVETLLSWLEQETAAECAGIAASAEREATEIERQAQASAERALAAEVERVRAEGEREIARNLASVTRQQRERALRTRSAMVDRTFAKAERMLAVIPLDRYQHRLEDLIEEVLRYLEGRPVTIVCSPEVAAMARQATTGRAMVRIEESAEVAAGLLAHSADGAVTVDNTWPSRLTRQRADLAIALVGRLEGTDAMG